MFEPNTTAIYHDPTGHHHAATIYPDNPDLPCCPNANYRLVRLDSGEMLCVHVDALTQTQTEGETE